MAKDHLIGSVEWDERKRLRILRERRIDFIDAAKILFNRVYEYQSNRKGETRFVAARTNEQRAYLHALSASPDEGAD